MNKLPFERFCETLQDTNKNLSFFVDWEKCIKNRDNISIALNHLNFLLGKNDLKLCIEKLFNEYKKVFEVLPILLAIRNQNEIVLDSILNITNLKSYTTSPEGIYRFIAQSGLDDLFQNKYIKDLNDYVFGIEVGLDTNARKNRSGKAMENHISKIFKMHNLKFDEQVNVKRFKDVDAIFQSDTKVLDFVIYGKKVTYFIECNFYSTADSKLNETARSYQEISPKFDNIQDKKFVWITDGKGWLGAKNKLEQAYKSVEIYNLSNINDFIQGILND